MRVGRLFTYNGTRYEPGDDFDLDSLPAFRQATFVRLYGLSEQPPKRAKKKAQKKKTDRKPVDDFPAPNDLIPSAMTESGETDE